jgi:histidinol-phosphate aminotransferase
MRCRGVFALDEAYFEFYGQTNLPLIRRFENLVIIRTLSKAFGLAAIRLGYLMAEPGLALQIEKAKLPFSVGLFQQTVGPLLLGRRGGIRTQARAIVAAREKVFKALRRIPCIDPVPSQANFILFAVRGTSARGLQQDLHRRGVLIRYFDTPRLQNMLRVTIGRPAENRLFLRQLRAAMKQRRGAR